MDCCEWLAFFLPLACLFIYIVCDWRWYGFAFFFGCYVQLRYTIISICIGNERTFFFSLLSYACVMSSMVDKLPDHIIYITEEMTQRIVWLFAAFIFVWLQQICRQFRCQDRTTYFLLQNQSKMTSKYRECNFKANYSN